MKLQTLLRGLILLAFSFFYQPTLFAQVGQCGGIVPFSSGSNFNSLTAPLQCANSGYFNVDCDLAFTSAELETICAVFEYVSDLVVNQTGAEVNIQLIKNSLSGTQLANATSIYQDDDNCGIVAPNAYRKINEAGF